MSDPFATNGNKNKPRNRSTNLRYLNKRISILQQETSPTISMTGSKYMSGTSNQKMVIRRRCNTSVSLTSNKFVFSSASLASVMPDGAKILNFKVVGNTCRNIRVKVPKDSVMMNRGPNNSEVDDLYRENWQPLSRFPSIKVNVPDTLAKAIDTADTNSILFEVQSQDVSTALITVSVTYQTMV